MNFNNFRENSNRVIFEIQIFQKKITNIEIFEKNRISKISRKNRITKLLRKTAYFRKIIIFDQKLSIMFQIRIIRTKNEYRNLEKTNHETFEKKRISKFSRKTAYFRKITIFDQKLSILFQIQSLWLNQKFS